jgi:hypothetical protein
VRKKRSPNRIGNRFLAHGKQYIRRSTHPDFLFLLRSLISHPTDIWKQHRKIDDVHLPLLNVGIHTYGAKEHEVHYIVDY